MISDNEKELSLQEIQQSSLEIVKKVRNICNENGLNYFLAYGTLIGAVRHKGFIPWDDDLDIVMPRPDYDKLLVYFSQNEESLYPFKIFNRENTDNYPYMISRVSNVNYRMVAKNEKSYGLGTFIDIYPLDGLGNDYDKACKIKAKASKLSSLCYLSTRLRCEREITKGVLKKIIKYPAFVFSKMVGKDYFMKQLDKFKDIYNYTDSEFISCVTWGSSVEKGVYPKELFGDGTDIIFEGEIFKAPLKYDAVLHQLYGDYMKMPPENERIQQHFYKIYRV